MKISIYHFSCSGKSLNRLLKVVFRLQFECYIHISLQHPHGKFRNPTNQESSLYGLTKPSELHPVLFGISETKSSCCISTLRISVNALHSLCIEAPFLCSLPSYANSHNINQCFSFAHFTFRSFTHVQKWFNKFDAIWKVIFLKTLLKFESYYSLEI